MATGVAGNSVSVLHQINVGETLTENVEGHAARTDSPEFVAARATAHKIVATLNPNPYGPAPIQAHHGGSLWLYDRKAWRIVLNWAGIEWSAQLAPDTLMRYRANIIRDQWNETAQLSTDHGATWTTTLEMHLRKAT